MKKHHDLLTWYANDIQSQMTEEIEDWIARPFMNTVQKSLDQAATYESALTEMIKSPEADKRVIGQLLGKVKSIQKSLKDIELKDWVKILDGHLAIGHRPSAKMMLDLKLQGTTHLFTLLSEKEGGDKIQKMTASHDMEWLWFPMTSALAPDQNRYDELRSIFQRMVDILNNRGKIYIHCSAGIHRTGMISLAFMNYLKLSKEDSLAKLAALRTETSQGVGDERSAWGLDFE